MFNSVGISPSVGIAEMVQSDVICFQDSSMAAEHVVEVFKKDRRVDLNLTVSFEGYTIRVEVPKEEPLAAPRNEDDRNKWYWYEQMGKSASIAKISCNRMPSKISNLEEDLVAQFAKDLTHFFFEVERRATDADPDDARRLYCCEVYVPVSYMPLSLEIPQKPCLKPFISLSGIAATVESLRI